MLEGDRQASLAVQPTVGDDGDIVVRWDRLEHWDSERDVVLVFSVPLAKDERVVEEDNLAVDIFNDDPERLCATVHLFVPAEVRRDGEIDSKK